MTHDQCQNQNPSQWFNFCLEKKFETFFFFSFFNNIPHSILLYLKYASTPAQHAGEDQVRQWSLSTPVSTQVKA